MENNGKKGELKPRCCMPWQSLMIEGNGTAQPCAYRGNYGNTAIHPPLGNVNQQTIEEIWNGEEAQKLRRFMAAGDLESAGCAGCLAVSQGLPLNMTYDPKVDALDAPDTAYKKNIELKRKEIKRGDVKIESKPLVLYVTPTHRCNLRCTHCYETPTRGETIRRDGFKEEVYGLMPYLSELVPGGGEPLILAFWRDLFAKPLTEVNPYLRIALATGGYYVADAVFENLKQFSDAQIMVSFDAPDRETFERIRKNARFEDVLGNMRKFRDITTKKREGSTIMHISAMKQNIKLLPEMIRLAAAMEVPVNFQPVVAYPVDHSLTCLEFGNEEMDGWKEAIDETHRLVKTLLLPALHAAAKRRGRAPEKAWDTLFPQNVVALSNLIPWHLSETQHYNVFGTVPTRHLPYLRFLRRFTLKDVQKGQAMHVVFFRKTATGLANPHHYAVVDGNGNFEAFLPEGEYLAALCRRESAPSTFNPFDFKVVPGDPATNRDFHRPRMSETV